MEKKKKKRVSKKEKRKKQSLFKFMIITIIILLICYIGYKFYIFTREKVIFDKVVIKDIINIDNIDNSCNVSDGNISLYIPSEFKINENINVNWYDLNYIGIDQRDASMAFIKLESFKKDIGAIRGNTSDGERLDKNNILTGYDLLKYYYNNQENDVNVFSSINKIKLNRMANYYINSVVISDEVYLLDGDIKGIMSVGEKNYHIVLYSDYYAYTVDFYNYGVSYFDYDKVIQYISMIRFNEEERV